MRKIYQKYLSINASLNIENKYTIFFYKQKKNWKIKSIGTWFYEVCFAKLL